MESLWKLMAPVLFYSACSSQASYKVLRYTVMYHAPDPFCIKTVDPETLVLSEDEVDANCCVRLYTVKGGKHTSEADPKSTILNCGRRELTEWQKSGKFAEDLLSWADLLPEFLDIHGIPSPQEVGFKTVANVQTHGSSLVMLYDSPEKASSGVADARLVFNAFLLPWPMAFLQF